MIPHSAQASLKLKTEYDDLEFSNEQLQQVLIKANDESNSKILALEISLKESNDAFRVAESERLKLQEQMSCHTTIHLLQISLNVHS